jgi:polysaccharide biosynthesis protein PslH
MKILQLCNKSPLPPREGGSIAMYHLASALIEDGHHVDVLAVTTPKFPHDPQMAANFGGHESTFDYCFIDTTVRIAAALNSYILRKPYHVVRFESDAFRKKLIHKLNTGHYDLVIFETLYMAPYLKDVREHSKAFCLLRSHNIEHQIWKRMGFHEKNPFKKHYLHHLTKMLKKYESKIISEFDAIGCISGYEVDYYRSIDPDCRAEVLPFGLNINPGLSNEGGGKDFYHIGSMDWMPNIEGIRWLIEMVVPILEKESPGVRIHLAGRNMPSWLRETKSHLVVIHGEVEDAAKFASDKLALLVPLLSGSGIRIKMIEAMAMGKAVVATTIGAEGINVRHEEDILIADDPVEFAGALIRLYNHPQEALDIGQKGRRLILGEHTYQAALTALEKLLKHSSISI